MMLTLADVTEALAGVRLDGAEIEIPQAAIDSRQVERDALFIALKGEQLDGHDFAADAFERGARFALVSRDVQGEYSSVDLRAGKLNTAQVDLDGPLLLRVDDSLTALQDVARYWRRKIDVRVIGITGSVGKSTTKEVTAEVLGQRYRTLKNPGNLNNEIGLPLTMLGLRDEHQRAVLEMGFYVTGEIEFLCEIAQPVVGVVTNVGLVHAERAGSQEAIAQGKAELVRYLPAEGTAILNIDDERVRAMADMTKAKVLYYGMDADADLRADEVEGLGLDGVRFRLHYLGEQFTLRVPMIGRHSVQTALRAIAVGLVEGLSWEEIVNGLRSGNTQLRLVAVRAENGALLLDDTYNSSPQSALAAINLLDEMAGRKIAVLGDMLELGPYEQEGHEMVGRRSAAVVERLITVGERAVMIGEAAREAGLPAEAITNLKNSDEAVRLLKSELKEDDVALVKGSHGMKMDGIVPILEAKE